MDLELGLLSLTDIHTHTHTHRERESNGEGGIKCGSVNHMMFPNAT